MVLAAALGLGLLAAGAAIPAAAAAAPFALDAPDNGSAPLIAYDPTTQDTYVVWQDPVQRAVDLCIVLAHTTGCDGGAPVLLQDSLFTGDNIAGPGGVVVLPGGEVAVIGNTTENGSIAWISPAGGAAFLTAGQGLSNGGEPISPVSLFYAVGNAVALSPTDVGLLDDYGDHFGDTPLTSSDPPISGQNTNQTTPPGEFPRKPLSTNGSEIAAEPAPAPAPSGQEIIVGVGDNYAGPSAALPGCLNSSGSGYGVSVGAVDGTSDASGTLNAEGLPAYHLLACSAQSPVIAGGGGAGIGVLEGEGSGYSGAGSDYTVDYRPFIATATGGSLGPAVQLADVTHESLDGAGAFDASDDSGTGVYGSWSDGKGLHLDYSGDAGAAWGPPAVVPPPASGEQSDPVIVGVGAGNAEVAYDSNPGTGTQVFLDAVNYQSLVQPAADTITTTQSSGTTTGASLSVPAGTIGETDTATITGANAASATGTVSYALYSSSTCAAPSLVFNGGTSTVAGGHAAPSVPVSTALGVGMYYWQAVYSGDTGLQGNAPGTSACGSEVLTMGSPVTTGATGSATTKTITVTISCAVTPCTVTLTITIPAGSAADIAGVSTAKKGKRKPLTLGSGKFTIKSKGHKKLRIKLSSKGKRYLRAHHGKLKTSLLIVDKTKGGTVKASKTLELKLPKHK